MLGFRFAFLTLLLSLAACGDDSAPADGGGDTITDDGFGVDDTGGQDAPGEDAPSEDARSDDTGSSDGGDDAGVEDVGADDGGASDAGDDAPEPMCTTSEDCGGDPCFLFPDGTRGCVSDPGDPPRETCVGLPDCGCETDADCTFGPGGVCVSFSYRYCGGAPPPPTNVCRYSRCDEDADCDGRAMGACLPRGVGGFTDSCAEGVCRTSADCRDAGTCDIYDEGCGSEGSTLFCRYPDDVCSDTVPCTGPMPMKCVPNEDGQGTRCVPDLPRP